MASDKAVLATQCAGRRIPLSLQTGKQGRHLTSLGGITELMAILTDYLKERLAKYSFIGYGAWNSGDTEALRCLLCPEHNDRKYRGPYLTNHLPEIIKEN
ncbi:MAG: hypothetical protein SVY53_01275 [Chloroflexota bacterium]|nr:hypothetical protein [Chloroflexota bacterium]